MPTILIDILPAKGHFYGSLKTIQKLQEAGYEILFLNMKSAKAEMEKFNFKIISCKDLVNEPMISNKQKFYWSLFWRLILGGGGGTQYKEHITQINSFKKFITNLSPELVILDEQNMLKAFYYELFKVPVVCIETKPEPCFSEHAPPFTSYFVPDDSAVSRLICRVLWRKKIWLNYYRLAKLKINWVGNDFFSMSCRFASENKLNLKKRIDLKRGYGIGLNGIPRLNAAPKAFNFRNNEKEGTHYIGPLVDINREGGIDNPRYEALRNTLSELNKCKERFVIFCSMGTITSTFQQRVRDFYLRIIKVSLLNPEDIFVLSSGSGFNLDELYPVPENVYVFGHVPQVDILQYCDIMITHGGINSITECIFCGVPTLNYPLSLEWDQPGCAARAEYHKVGLMGKIEKDSAKTISKKLNQIKSDYGFFQNNVLNMKRKFERKNNSDEILDIVNEIITKSNNKNNVPYRS